jgi:hypothetical protein
LVQTPSSPARFGFVPSDYLQPVAGGPAPSASPAPAPRSTPPASDASVAASFLQRLGTSASALSSTSMFAQGSASSQLLGSSFYGGGGGGGSGAGAGGGSGGGGGSAATPASLAAHQLALSAGTSVAGAGASAAEEFGQLFASHEEWFRAATAKRQEVYKHLLGEAGDIARSLQESEARSAAVVGRIAELDALISNEKARWASAAVEA